MKSTTIANTLSFLLAVLSPIEITLFGTISTSELFALLTLPLLYAIQSMDRIAFHINKSTTIKMLLFWAVGIGLSDLFYNDTSFNNFLKGIGHPSVIFICFLYFQKLLQISNRTIYYYILGAVFASVINYFINPLSVQFRFGFFNIITSIVAFVSYLMWSNKSNQRYVIFLFVILSGIGMWKGGRSSGLLLLTIAIILFKFSKLSNYKIFNISKINFITAIFSVFLFVYVIQEAYIFTVEQNIYSPEYQEKFEKQLQNGLPVIFSGRSEIYSSVVAISDSPIFGHGSWAKGPKYMSLFIDMNDPDLDVNHPYYQDIIKNAKIPSHSFFFGSWVDHGLIAAFFFLFFASRLFHLYVYCYNNRSQPYIPFLLLLFTGYTWHFFFSPLGYDKRLMFSLILALNSFYIQNTINIRKSADLEKKGTLLPIV